jgi:predicted ester cyclase
MNEAIDLLTRLLKEGFEGGDTGVVDEVMAEDFVEHQFGAEAAGAEARENVKATIRDVRTMAPDITFTVEDSVADGDRGWLRVTARGTNSGPLFGRPATGRPFIITGFEVVRVEGGKVAEHWGVPDRFAMLVQVGALGGRPS